MHDNFKVVLEKLLPDEKEREAFFACYHELLPRSIKIIEHKIAADIFTNYTQSLGWKLTPPPFIKSNDSWYITRENDELALGKHFLHTAGFFYIQEVAASLAVHSLNIAPGDIILDMCAAPGGKSTQIADRLLALDARHPGLVVSNEISSSRIVALQSNLNRTGAYNTAVTKLDGEKFGALLPEFFDKVLVDAPCSGEGTGFKSDASTKRRREENVQMIAKLQYSLLVSAINACKPGGEIVYATCTLNPWENEFVLSKALAAFAGKISLEHVDINGKSSGLTHWDNEELLSKDDADKAARFWPQRQHTGGFFISKIRKFNAEENTERIQNSKSKIQNKSSFDISDKLQEKIAKMLHDEYDIEVDPEKYFFVGTDKQIYLTSPKYRDLHALLYVEKTGIPLFKRHSETEIHPLHGLGNCLGSYAATNCIELSDEQCQRYSDGFDIELSDNQLHGNNVNKYVILKRQGKGFSVGKVVGTTLKNKFAK